MEAMLLRLVKNADRCMSDTPKVVDFGESDMDATTILESPSNIT
ncbi:hypothetical protein PRLR5025_31870 [Prevotella lacticifex]|nr:hypothetical protein PRLR5025_31870 [Prevotella lacticifex]